MINGDSVSSVVVEDCSPGVLLTLVFSPSSPRKPAADGGLVIVDRGELAGSEFVGAEEVGTGGDVMGVFSASGLASCLGGLAGHAERGGAAGNVGGAARKARVELGWNRSVKALEVSWDGSRNLFARGRVSGYKGRLRSLGSRLHDKYSIRPGPFRSIQ